MTGVAGRDRAGYTEAVARSGEIQILIPTKGRHERLATTLAQLDGDVLVCDQSPDPRPPHGARYLHRPDLSGLPAARNRLLRAATAEWVLFLDDDAVPAPGFLDELAALIAAQPAVVAWGPVVESRTRCLRRAHRALQLGALRDPRRLTAGPADLPTRALFGCCFAVRRTHAIACGGFDQRRRGYALGEDLDFFLRLAGEKRFAASLRCTHHEDRCQRADPVARGRAKGATLRWLARRHGRGNPATAIHLGLACLAAAAAGRLAREPAAALAVIAGVAGRDPFADVAPA